MIFTLLGFLAVFLFGAYVILQSLGAMYITYLCSGKIEYMFIVPLLIGCAIVYGALTYVPFEFSMVLKG